MPEPASPLAVVHERLPYIDRRALSQAWISAFHLAAHMQAARRVPAVRRVPIDPGAAQRRALPAPGSARHAAPCDVPVRGSSRPGGRALAPETGVATCAVRSRAAERIAASSQVRVDARNAQAAFTLEVDGTRVQIVARRTNDRIDVIALCSARTAEAVRRILLGADRELRGTSDRLRASVHALGGDGE